MEEVLGMLVHYFSLKALSLLTSQTTEEALSTLAPSILLMVRSLATRLIPREVEFTILVTSLSTTAPSPITGAMLLEEGSSMAEGAPRVIIASFQSVTVPF